MCEQEKKQRIYDLLKTEIKQEFLCQSNINQRIIFREKELFKEKWGGLNKE